MSPKFMLDVTKEDYEKAGSKFITFPPDAKIGDVQFREIEIGDLDWDTPGQSMKIPITVTEKGVDEGKADKLSFGVKDDGIWKGKAVYRNIASKDMPFEKGADKRMHPAPDSDDLAGKPAVGVWKFQKGQKGGVGEPVEYPKLVDILPAGSKPQATKLL